MVKGSKPQLNQICRQMTFNVAKYTHKIQNKKKAPRCVREIRKLVTKMFKTKDVRIDTKLNKLIWSRGIHALPRRIRIKVSRKIDSSNQKQKNQAYCLVEGLHALKKGNKELFQGKLTQKKSS